MKDYPILLKTIVGSQAHGLATSESDYDYRGVFIVPTRELLSLGNTSRTTSWIEGNDDDTSWEIGHFLNMATHCNPTVLETFLAPKANIQAVGYIDDVWADKIRALFPYIWNSVDVKNAFIGYGLNQRKKFFDNKDNRAPKYAAAYLRTLYNAWELLSTGTFTVRVADTEIGETVRNFKEGRFTHGEVIQVCWDWETKVLKAFEMNPDKKTDVEPVNELLLEARKVFWE